MMRLARGTTLLVALSLLTSAATAHAECAWVLWGEHIQSGAVIAGGRKEQWEIVETHDTRDRCTADLKDRVSKLAAHARKRAAEGRVKSKVDVSENAVVSYLWGNDPVPDAVVSSRFRCLPDTVDPPTGK